MPPPHASTSKHPYPAKRARTGSNAAPVGFRRPSSQLAAHDDSSEAPRRPLTSDGNHKRPRTDTAAAARGRTLSLAGTVIEAVPDLTGVSKLDLSNCKLTKLDFVRHAKDTLTWLNVSGNNLSAPDAFQGVQELEHLSVLNVSNCALKSVPSCVSKLRSLKAFVATHNSFRKLNHLANLPELNTIIVSHNKLESLPTELATLPSLKKISASHNRLSAGSLPDLSALKHLKEIKFNDNPTLDSLPDHFTAWGKFGQVGATNSGDKTKHSGLEIVDFGSCGFKEWVSLRQLAAHSGVYNLVLKGNQVTTDALADTSFDELKEKVSGSVEMEWCNISDLFRHLFKMLILLPNLRVFDGQRFDAKFQDLKARRDARAPEDKVLDAGPMGLAINAAKEEPVAISHEAMTKRMQAKRDKLIEKRLKNGLEVRRDWLREYEQRKGSGDTTKDQQDESAEVDGVLRHKKRKTVDSDEDNAKGQSSEDSVPKKKKKNRHEARRQAGAEAQADRSAKTAELAEAEQTAVTAEEKSPTAAADAPNISTKKAKADKKAANDPLVDALAAVDKSKDAAAPPAEKPKKNRHKKDKKPLLADLLGSEQDEPRLDASKPATASTELKDEAEEPETKEKTSILKVVEVRKKNDKKSKGKQVAQTAAVESLLGLAAQPDQGAQDAAGDESQGLVGLGWD
ncbi:hypothetical protein OIV83_004319 [Microbotryomycetes sp. JL201]|nr:hypothetical protein OIV83_004307 [Microbotryomycetes sp. JL201]KAK4049172.1 hypothetical protein OIV83_004319 [Microbotryomycetes sp. JL201]